MEGSHVQTLVYSMVARGEVVLAHYSAFPTASASFATLAAACLPALALGASSSSSSATSSTNTNTKMISYTRDAHNFHFLIQHHFTYLIVSDDSEGEGVALTFLCRIKEDFYKRYGDAATNSEVFKEHSLDKDFGPRMKEHMQYCLDHYQNFKRVPSIKDQILEVKGIVAENIEKVLDTRQSIDLNVDNNEIIHAYVENFHRQGQQLKRKMWRRQVKLRLLVFLISVILILFIWLIICKGVICSKNN